MNTDFWKNKKVFITGHTGFKGGWMSLWLNKLGAKVKGYALDPQSDLSLFNLAKISDNLESQIGNIQNLALLKQSLKKFEPEIVIHMAAQPLVRASYNDPVETYKTNVMGTVNLFEAVRECESVKVVVNVTTDKCYENNEWLWGYRENEPMGGRDPYSNSKGCSELITAAYRQSFFNSDSAVSIASARAGNVIGGGDWAEDRLVPDALRAFNSGKPLVIRNPLAIRPWQHVLEPISGYLALAEKLYLEKDEFAEAWNFGPNEDDSWPVGEVVDFLVTEWPSYASWELQKGSQPHEAQLLKLDISKAKSRLNWKPLWNLEQSLKSIIDWNSAHINNKNMQEVTMDQINNYEKNRRIM